MLLVAEVTERVQKIQVRDVHSHDFWMSPVLAVQTDPHARVNGICRFLRCIGRGQTSLRFRHASKLACTPADRVCEPRRALSIESSGGEFTPGIYNVTTLEASSLPLVTFPTLHALPPHGAVA